MIKIDVHDGTSHMEGSPAVLSCEIATLIGHINELLDSRSETERIIIEEAIVLNDGAWAEMCKFACRFNEARKRAEKVKKEHPNVFDESLPREVRIKNMQNDIESKIRELFDKLNNLDKE